VHLGLTFAGAVSDYSVPQIATLKDALRMNLSCTAPDCVMTLRVSAASVLFSLELAIPDNGPGNSSAAVAQATAAANAVKAKLKGASAESERLSKASKQAHAAYLVSKNIADILKGKADAARKEALSAEQASKSAAVQAAAAITSRAS
jgi:hypothetical protein